ncbi:hypothetical protein [uncultured Ruegeria sp.]|nr:hypothetical protein [uncultured Ruegeria sp.]
MNHKSLDEKLGKSLKADIARRRLTTVKYVIGVGILIAAIVVVFL